MIWGDDFSDFDFEPEVPSVSFVCPTRNRPARHEHLYLQYAQQTVSPKELIVGDEGEAPSEFFRQLDDPTVHYTYFPEKLTLGDKRNRLNDMAAGDVIASAAAAARLTVAASSVEPTTILAAASAHSGVSATLVNPMAQVATLPASSVSTTAAAAVAESPTFRLSFS